MKETILVQSGDLIFRSCPYCGIDDFSQLYRKGNIPSVSDRKTGRLCLVECNSCGTIYVNPAPTKDTLMDYYPEEYYNNIEESTISIANDIARMKSYLHRFVKTLVKDRSCLGSSVLEVGCAGGNNLIPFVEKKWTVCGLEPNPRLAKISSLRGIKVVNGFLDADVFGDMKFDVIILSHVLEHEYEPLKMMKVLSSKLKAGGLIYVEVPICESPSRYIFGKYWGGYEFPLHLTLFKKTHLLNIVKDSNLTPVRSKYVIMLGDVWRALSKRISLRNKRFHLLFLTSVVTVQAVLLIVDILLRKGEAFAMVAQKAR